MSSICGILLAAGESTRMGTPKPLLPWFGATLVERQAEALLKAGVRDVYVVTGHRAYEVQAKIRGSHLYRVLNPHYKLGKSTSIKAGLAALPKTALAIVLLAVDQPRPAWLIRQVLDSHISEKALISCPRYRGHGGHPLVFKGSLRVELDSISEASQGVRAVVKSHADQVNWIDIDSPIARLD
ncbi:MAG: nucleotidyltransferase family protein, partial [Chloroflexi bacterium]|nr:nucleotidyltransferase family protein [Chloroflexota bacterium]